ncbi:MAG: HD domain-containing protein [Candidatus Omnitrophica bacterium]|nr:HD domain-containing protein [Candidatus Omnitrophota bacterium]
MKIQTDLTSLSFDWISKITGAHLRIENIIREMLISFKKEIGSGKAKFILWDASKKKFLPDICLDEKLSFVRPSVNESLLLEAKNSREPVFLGRRVLLPFRLKDKFLGVLVFEPTFTAGKLAQKKEDLVRFADTASVSVANTQFFIESEKRNQDLFKFNVLSRALNPTVDEEAIVKIITEGVDGILKSDIFSLLVLGKHSQRLYITSKKPLTEKVIHSVRKGMLDLLANFSKKPFDTRNLSENRDIPKGKAQASVIKSFFNAPLITKNKLVGAIGLSSFNLDGFSIREQQNLSILASQAAVAFENSMLYEDLKDTYFSIVKVLTEAVEAKDPYTRGHSVLVSKYASAIAKQMGLSSSMVESIQIAGLLHDLGKIGVPEEILLKNGKLTNGEYEVVKSHSEIALKILGPVEFPNFSKGDKSCAVLPELTLSLFETVDLSADIKLMIYHHHEKYTGGGYPKGLKKEEIPLGARIMAVADTFEALTADRPYRRAFPLDKAKKILKEIMGEQLDPRITVVFLKMLTPKWFKEQKEITACK